jgi:hypothetical protein
MIILATVDFIILLGLSLLHFYWALGGEWGFAAALPTNEAGKRMLNPKKIDSAIVALGLLAFAIYVLIYTGLLGFYLPAWVLAYGIWLIIFIFIVRAIGDFKYVGFFKRVKNTDFAQRDTKFYSPLCLILGVINLFLIIHFTNQ